MSDLETQLATIKEDNELLDLEVLGKLLAFTPSISPLQIIFCFKKIDCFPQYTDHLGYDEIERDQHDRRDVYSLAGDVVQELVEGCRKTCKYLGLKRSKNCSATKLAQKMKLATTFIQDKQGSSARGAARISLAVCLAQHLDLDLDLVTSGLPEGCDEDAVLHACHGFDNRMAKCVDHKA